MVITNAYSTGSSFGRSGSWQSRKYNSSISSVTVDGRQYSGTIFDASGRRINWLVRQLIQSLNALGWRLLLLLQNYLIDYFHNGIPKTQHVISSIFSKIAKTYTQVNYDQFRHQKLSKAELLKVCSLGINSWADRGCARKHAYIEEFISGRTVNATVFAPSLGSLNNLTIANVLYAYDTTSGKQYYLSITMLYT